MKSLNEPIARKANIEDQCTGHFWEGRFKSQALLDEQALLTCMAYVELNPIRAKMANTPETSEFTSIKQRIEESKALEKQSLTEVTKQEKRVVALKEFLLKGDYLSDQIPYGFHEYLALVDWSGRVIREGKRGSIDTERPSILARLGIDAQGWCKVMQPKGAHQFSRAMGCRDKLREYAEKLNLRWIKGIVASTKLFPT
jgi:hypothetical protein